MSSYSALALNTRTKKKASVSAEQMRALHMLESQAEHGRDKDPHGKPGDSASRSKSKLSAAMKKANGQRFLLV